MGLVYHDFLARLADHLEQLDKKVVLVDGFLRVDAHVVLQVVDRARLLLRSFCLHSVV